MYCENAPCRGVGRSEQEMEQKNNKKLDPKQAKDYKSYPECHYCVNSEWWNVGKNNYWQLGIGEDNLKLESNITYICKHNPKPSNLRSVMDYGGHCEFYVLS